MADHLDLSMSDPEGLSTSNDHMENSVHENTFDFDDDEEPPLEPRFKYERLQCEETMTFMKTETFTSIDLHDKFIAIGTAKGSIYILDHHGYGNFDSMPVLKAHRCAVSKVKFDETGSYILSCANDGKLVVSGLGNDKLCCTVNIQVMPKSISISPDFIRQQSGHCFTMGERNLVLYEKRFFQYKATTLYAGSERDGFIHCCSWNDNFIAFTNDTGTRIYERGLEKTITFIQPSHDVDRVRTSRSPPRHVWMPEHKLVIGWADTVTVVKINDVGESRRGEVHHIFRVEMFVCGMSYIPESGNENLEFFIVGLQLADDGDMDDSVSVMSTATTLTALESSAGCVLKTAVIRPLGLKEYELQSEDELLSDRNPLPAMIHALGIPYLSTYFIMTTKQIILAIPYGPKDGIKWRMKYKLYDEAFEMAKHHAELLAKTECSRKNVGRDIIRGYLEGSRAKAAASRLPAICGDSKEEWEWAVEQFTKVKLCTLLADVIPDENPILDAEIYNKVLIACLFNKPYDFRRLVHSWNPDRYQTSVIIQKLHWRLIQFNNKTCTPEENELEKILLDSLAHLFIYERKYENALKILMHTQDIQVFNIIEKHQLFDLVKDRLTDLMTINQSRALKLLLDNADSLEPASVMNKLGRHPQLQLAYLKKLMSKNEGVEFADKAVQLYAEYEKDKLLPFLRKNANYNVNRARKLCSDKGLVEETIYLLAKSGNHYDAVKMMVKEYGNFEKVIAYCKDQNDPDLWIHLLEVVTEYPAYLSQLIIESSNCLDPLLILQKLPADTDIPNLSDALLKLLEDYSNYVDLEKCCYDSTLNDLNMLTKNLTCTAEESVSVDLMTKCALCSEVIINATMELKKFKAINVFKCGHVFHLNCTPDKPQPKMVDDSGKCVACSDQEKSI